MEPVKVSASDRNILRQLAGRRAELARLPIQAERTELWRRQKQLQSVRPMLHIIQIPWHEMNVNDELTLRCEAPFLRGIECGLRQELYQWVHMPGDMILDPVYYVGLACGPTSSYADYGIQEKNIVAADGQDVGYEPIIHSEKDVDQLRTPRVWVDREDTAQRQALLAGIFGDLLPVKIRGLVHAWSAPWDQMIHWYGIEQLFTDMSDRPELVHYLLRKFTDAQLEVLKQWEALGILDVGSGNYGVGSGGLGFTDELPTEANRPAHITPKHQWGCSTGQIFSDVSPDMHEEFCLRYEKEWLSKFGLTYYGCCEPLHRKLGILRQVPNLRAISMSPWIDVEAAAGAVGADYVFSYKPNPALLATTTWNPQEAETHLRKVLEHTRGGHVELVFKDISTVHGEPQRLWDWAAIAARLAQDYAH